MYFWPLKVVRLLYFNGQIKSQGICERILALHFLTTIFQQGDEMKHNLYKRKQKEALPVLAICYDFDKTLSPDDMQAQGYIQAVGYDVSDFWKESNALAENNDMDQNLAYMYMMQKEAEGKVLFTKEKLA